MKSSVKERGKGSTKIGLMLMLISFLVTPTEAFFRHLCFNPLGFGRVDPIVSPGKPSQHLHHLHGSGNLGIDSTDADYLIESNCTSCSITVDKSGYWAPAMYFQHENGTFELMSTSGSITIYYKTEKRANFENQNYTVFPKNFRMVAGNNTKRDWVGPWPIRQQSFWTGDEISQDALASKALGFNCLNYERGWEEATFAYGYLRNKSYTDANCLQGIRAEILFPSCWDGVNLDSPDHKSHVAYPTLLQDGACPATHQVYLPILFYETIWNTQDFIGVPGQYVFSNGDPTGYGYHGDFLCAWEDGVLDQVVADPTCTDHNLTDRHTNGITEDCMVFNGHIQSQDVAAQCKLEQPESLMQEKAVGLLSVLPGDVQVTGLRHDPDTDASEQQVVPAVPAAPVVPAPPSPAAMPGQATTTPGPSSPTATPANTTVLTSNTPAVPTTAVSVATVVSKSIFTSDGTLYEIDFVQQWTTVTETKISVDVATTTLRRRHDHGRLHHDVN